MDTTFFTLICRKNCNDVCLKRPKLNEKEAGDGPFFNFFRLPRPLNLCSSAKEVAPPCLSFTLIKTVINLDELFQTPGVIFGKQFTERNTSFHESELISQMKNFLQSFQNWVLKKHSEILICLVRRCHDATKTSDLKKVGHARPLFHLFSVFFKKTIQFLQQINVKKCQVHPVSGVGIRTHDLLNLSLLP